VKGGAPVRGAAVCAPVRGAAVCPPDEGCAHPAKAATGRAKNRIAAMA